MAEEETRKEKISMWPQQRLFGFTDGIFAFAITLLVLNLIDLHVPAGDGSLMPIFKTNASALIIFVATFVIIARFWMSHTRLFAIIKEVDRAIIMLNNTLLFFITIFPFVVSIFGTHIENKDAVIMYAACFAIVGILQYLIGRHANRNGLLISDDLRDRNFLKIFTFYTLSTPVVFIISIFVALVSTYAAEVLWVVLFFLRMGFRYYYRNNRGAEIELNKL